ncbi:hypothetical protein ACFY36_32480 [Actinoplanes sp. NPDC000266]
MSVILDAFRLEARALTAAAATFTEGEWTNASRIDLARAHAAGHPTAAALGIRRLTLG